MKTRILILYDYFDPAYKAGGPIRSLVNLVRLIEDEFELYVLTTNQDHDGTVLKVETDKWVGYSKNTQVKYLSKGNRSLKSIKNSIREVKPDVVYLNGIFSLAFVLYPLWALRKHKNIRLVIAPRGMLQQGALMLKPIKKQIYLLFFRYLLKKIVLLRWHATDSQEKEDIKKIFRNSGVFIAGNIPAFDSDIVLNNNYIPELHFVSISLLTRKKNHLAFIEALKYSGIKIRIVYHIFGPISDQEYFNLIKKNIADTSDNIEVKYMGVVRPSEVSRILQKYSFYVLTSYGENFGHSIFEAFNNGVPVIISDQTPWKGLKEKKAGWDVDLNDPDALVNAIREAVNMDNETYLEFRKGARKMAGGYMRDNDFASRYKELFDG